MRQKINSACFQTTNPNDEYVKKLSENFTKEKEKEEKRRNRVIILNKKVEDEVRGQPVKVNGKFTLKHVQSGKFLDVIWRTHPCTSNKEMTEVSLTDKPKADVYFTLKSSDTTGCIEYENPVRIFIPKYNHYLTDSSPLDKYAINKEAKDLSPTKEFPNVLPLRRREAQAENDSKFIVGCQFNTKKEVIFSSYNTKQTDDFVLKTGQHLRFSSSQFYLTSYSYTSQEQSSNSNGIYAQKIESLDYKFNHSSTIYTITSAQINDDQLPKQEIITPIDIEKLLKNDSKTSYSIDSDPTAKKYLLRHEVSGQYLALKVEIKEGEKKEEEKEGEKKEGEKEGEKKEEEKEGEKKEEEKEGGGKRGEEKRGIFGKLGADIRI